MPPQKTGSVGERSRLAGAEGVSSSYTTGRGNQGRFNRGLLPTPAAVLARVGIKLGQVNRAGYCLVKCPFHKNGKEQHASLSIHQINGNYRCFACGAHGGDVLSLWMQYTGKPFKQAARELGAWGNGHD
jgi:hypothetical protein